jgi:hypothetical protein
MADQDSTPTTDDLTALRARVADLEAERDKLKAFKAWTHDYLDKQGVPHHPPGPHGAEGCRIGDRMDWFVAQLVARDARIAQVLALPVTEFDIGREDIVYFKPFVRADRVRALLVPQEGQS